MHYKVKELSVVASLVKVSYAFGNTCSTFKTLLTKQSMCGSSWSLLRRLRWNNFNLCSHLWMV